MNFVTIVPTTPGSPAEILSVEILERTVIVVIQEGKTLNEISLIADDPVALATSMKCRLEEAILTARPKAQEAKAS